MRDSDINYNCCMWPSHKWRVRGGLLTFHQSIPISRKANERLFFLRVLPSLLVYFIFLDDYQPPTLALPESKHRENARVMGPPCRQTGLGGGGLGVAIKAGHALIDTFACTHWFGVSGKGVGGSAHEGEG